MVTKDQSIAQLKRTIEAITKSRAVAIETANRKNTSLQAQVNALTAENNALKTQVTSLQADLAACRAQSGSGKPRPYVVVDL